MGETEESVPESGDEALPSQTEDAPRRPRTLLLREIVETLLLALFIFGIVNTVTGRYRVDGHSMMPGLVDGEYLIVSKAAYFLDEPERGDIIVLRFPDVSEKDYIKRVIGLPGDHIEIAESTVRVNGVALDEPYTNGIPYYRSASWTVPQGHYFVMGDNRNNSSDSRVLSFVPRRDIVGKAWLIYWGIENWGLAPHVHHQIS